MTNRRRMGGGGEKDLPEPVGMEKKSIKGHRGIRGFFSLDWRVEDTRPGLRSKGVLNFLQGYR